MGKGRLEVCLRRETGAPGDPAAVAVQGAVAAPCRLLPSALSRERARGQGADLKGSLCSRAVAWPSQEG